MTTASVYYYATSLLVPANVRTFFDTLREFGTIKAVTTHAVGGGVTLYLPDEGDGMDGLNQRLLRLAQSLGSKGLSPAWATSGHWNPHGTLPGESYRWAFDEPTYASEGEWDILVPITDDVRHLLDTVTGLASYDRDYKGESILPVAYYPDNEGRATTKAMHDDLRSMEDDFEAWYGETVTFEPPTPVFD